MAASEEFKAAKRLGDAVADITFSKVAFASVVLEMDKRVQDELFVLFMECINRWGEQWLDPPKTKCFPLQAEAAEHLSASYKAWCISKSREIRY